MACDASNVLDGGRTCHVCHDRDPGYDGCSLLTKTETDTQLDIISQSIFNTFIYFAINAIVC